MNRERQIFAQLLDIPSPEERAGFLRGACGDDEELRRAVEELIEAHEASEDFLRTLPGELGTIAAEGVGSRIGRYHLLERIGEGGFGVVYMAEQREPVRRRVALKIIKAGLDTKQVVARFEAERQALATLDHPNITKVLDGGATESGRPYFVMELVRGMPLLAYCDENRLTAGERLNLFLQVCNAIQHAHQKGIIHRDIKPANVLVTMHDEKAVPKVIDFGIAKAVQHDLTDKTVFTRYQDFIGTPAYMSPEQAQMSGLDIDTRCDVYALGVLLYELLTGRPPFDAKTLISAGYQEMLRVICEEEPSRPSTRVATLQAEELAITVTRRGTQLPKLVSVLRGDLDWIVMRCLEKDRMRRYETANALAMDVSRFLGNEPVTARPPSTVYRIQKSWRRNRLAYTAAASVLAALVVGLGSAIWMFVRERDAYHEMALARDAEASALEAEYNQRIRAESNALEAKRNLYAADIQLASVALERGDVQRGTQLLDRHRPREGEADVRGLEWRYLWSQAQSNEIASFPSGRVGAVAFSPDGRFLAQSNDDEVRIWDVPTMGLLSKLALGDQQRAAPTLSFSAASDRLLVGSLPKVTIWETENWTQADQLEGVWPAVFSPDGRWLAVERGQDCNVLDARTGKAIDVFPCREGGRGLGWHSRHLLVFSPDGEFLMVPQEMGEHWGNLITLWHLSEHKPHTMPIPEIGSWPTAAAFSSDGKRIFIGGWTGSLIVWDLPGNRVFELPKAHAASIWDIKVSPDGKMVATASADRTIILWDTATGERLVRFRGHLGEVWGVDFSSDSRRLVSVSPDRTMRVWDATKRQRELTFEQTWNPVGFLHGERQLISVHPRGILQIWDIGSKQKKEYPLNRLVEDTQSQADYGADLSPDRSTIALGTIGGRVELWSVESQELIKAWKVDQAEATDPKAVQAVRFSSDGRLLATGDNRGTAHVWEVPTGREVVRYPVGAGSILCVAFSPDNRFLAVAGGIEGRHGGGIWIWDLAQDQEHAALGREDGPDGQVRAVAFSPDGSLLASASNDNAVRVWELPSGTLRSVLDGHLMGVSGLAFTPDGKTLTTGSHDSTIKFWHLDSGQEMMTIELDGSPVSHWFSEDGRTMVVSSFTAKKERRVQLYQIPSWNEIAKSDSFEADVVERAGTRRR